MRIAPLLISALCAGSIVFPVPHAYALAAATDNDAGTIPAFVLPQSVLDIPMVESDSAAEDTIEDSGLTGLRGGESLVVGNQTLSAISNGNSIGGSYTAGNVTLSDNALSNFAGIGNIVINTGAQANLQAGMNLIINLVP